jgi:tetratricopeptide (TPR) repeat protein
VDDIDAWVWVLNDPHNHNQAQVPWEWEWVLTEPHNHNQARMPWWEWVLTEPNNHNQSLAPAVDGGSRIHDRVGTRESGRGAKRAPALAGVPVRGEVHGGWPRALRSNAEARRWHAAGHPTRALRPARAALTIVEQERGLTCAEAVYLCLGLSELHEQISEYDLAEVYALRAARSAQSGAADAADGPRAGSLRIRVLARLAAIERIRGRIDNAERLYREALELAEAEAESEVGADAETDALDGDDLVAVLCGLGIVYKDVGRFDEAEALYRRALTIASPRSFAAASLWHNLAGLDHARGRYAEGEPAARRSVALRIAAVGPRHPSVAADQAALASLLAGQGKHAEAEALYRKALTVFEHVYPSNSYEIAVTCNDLGVLIAARGDVQSAGGFLQRALRIKQTILGADHPEVALTRRNLAATTAADRFRQVEGSPCGEHRK